ncbi:26S proteasome non-ATPase regulatory subunit 6 [Cryptosporidium felis]|nr:26S proteasome non-ATPase regulatory subunit 6 [Cryptosporidium felis]
MSLEKSDSALETLLNPEELLQSVPNLELAEKIHFLNSIYCEPREKEAIRNEVIFLIEKFSMAPLYQFLENEMKITIGHDDLLKKMVSSNCDELKTIENKIKDAIDNYGDLEVRNSHYRKLVYFTRIGSKECSIKELEIAIEKTTGGLKLELLFLGIRIGLFWSDLKLLSSYIKRSRDQLKTTDDWERKNRFKVYQAIFYLISRNFSAASELFLDSLTTFTAVELLSFEKLIFYTVISSIFSVDRKVMKTRLLSCPDILKIALQPSHKYLLDFTENFYNGRYQEFFSILVDIIYKIQRDVYMHKHHRYYLRYIRMRAYIQYLEPFESVSIPRMAESFGVSPRFLEKDVITFIASSKLPCTIDRVKQLIVCKKVDPKIKSYYELTEKGDTLLNRLQRLTRIIQV